MKYLLTLHEVFADSLWSVCWRFPDYCALSRANRLNGNSMIKRKLVVSWTVNVHGMVHGKDSHNSVLQFTVFRKPTSLSVNFWQFSADCHELRHVSQKRLLASSAFPFWCKLLISYNRSWLVCRQKFIIEEIGSWKNHHHRLSLKSQLKVIIIHWYLWFCGIQELTLYMPMMPKVMW